MAGSVADRGSWRGAAPLSGAVLTRPSPGAPRRAPSRVGVAAPQTRL